MNKASLLFITFCFFVLSSSFSVVNAAALNLSRKRIKSIKQINTRIRNKRRALRKRGKSLTRLNLLSNELKNFRGLNLPNSLEYLNLDFNPVRTYEGLNLPKGLKTLITSTFDDSSSDFSSLSLNENLETLTIGSPLGDFDPNTIKFVPPNLKTVLYTGIDNLDQMIVADSLKNIYLRFTGVDDGANWSLIPSGLDCLTLQVTNSRVRDVSQIQLPSDLKCFEIGGTVDINYDNIILPEGMEHFAIAGEFARSQRYRGDNIPSSLRSLDIDAAAANSTYLSDLEISDTNLEVLTVYGGGFSSIDLGVGSAILALDFPESLKSLDLHENYIYNINNLKLPPNLVELDLQFCRINTLDDLKNETFPESLRGIYLFGNPVARTRKKRRQVKNYFAENYPNIDVILNSVTIPVEKLVPYVLFDPDKISSLNVNSIL